MSLSGDASASRSWRWITPVSFLILLAAHAWLWRASVVRDAAPLTAAEASHMRSAWKYRADVSARRWSELLRPVRTPGRPPSPPLIELSLAAGASLAPVTGLSTEDAAALANLFFLLILGGSVFLIASDWWGPTAGLSAAFLVSFLPAFLSRAPHLQADVGLAAWVAAAYACWNAARGFSLWGWSIALGGVGGAGFLTDASFPVYVLPILAVCARDFFLPRERGARVRMLAAALITGLLAAPWYLTNGPELFVRASRTAFTSDNPVRGLESWIYYAAAIKNGAGWIAAAAALGGSVWLALWRPRNFWTLAFWAASGYLWWTLLVPHKDPRYILPILAALALAAASLPFHLSTAVSLVVAGAAGWAALSPPARPLPPWPLEEIVAVAARGRENPAGPPAVMSVLANHPFLNSANLSWTAERGGMAGAVTARGRIWALGAFSEFVLVKTGDLGPPQAAAGHERLRAEALRPDGWFERNYARKGAWGLPDGGEALLFQRLSLSSAPVVQMAPAGVLPALWPGATTEGLAAVCDGGGLLEGSGDCDVTAEKLRVKGLILRDADLRLEGLHVTADDEGRPRLLDLKRVQLRAFRMTESDASLFLGTRLKVLKGAAVRFLPENEVEMSGRLAGAPLRVRVRLDYSSAQGLISLRILSAKLFGIPCSFWRTVSVSLAPHRGWPFHLILSGLRVVPASPGEEAALEAAPRKS